MLIQKIESAINCLKEIPAGCIRRNATKLARSQPVRISAVEVPIDLLREGPELLLQNADDCSFVILRDTIYNRLSM